MTDTRSRPNRKHTQGIQDLQDPPPEVCPGAGVTEHMTSSGGDFSVTHHNILDRMAPVVHNGSNNERGSH